MAVNVLYHQTVQRIEEELEWIRLAKVNPAHFAPLYKRYHEQIFRYIYLRMEDDEMAYDITSQVFVKAIQHISTYEYRGVPFSSWLYRIAKSELYQSFRDKQANRMINVDTMQLGHIVDELEEENDELNRKRLVKGLAQLKEKEIQFIEMRFFEKRSFKEIGEILGITENNAKVKTFRVLEKLKSIVKSTHEHELQ
jgi:RNA polymerase sigma-70 factor (ECF subfamily)